MYIYSAYTYVYIIICCRCLYIVCIIVICCRCLYIGCLYSFALCPPLASLFPSPSFHLLFSFLPASLYVSSVSASSSTSAPTSSLPQCSALIDMLQGLHASMAPAYYCFEFLKANSPSLSKGGVVMCTDLACPAELPWRPSW